MTDTSDSPVAAAPSVGVVIPTRNRPNGLLEALDSVRAQQGSMRISVVIVDDGSDPPVSSWLNCPDPRLTLLRNDRSQGPAVARNQGVAALNTQWVAFLDDDDRWLTNKVDRCLSCVRQHPNADLVVHRSAIREPAERTEATVRVVDDPVRFMLARQPPHVDCIMVRRAEHEKVEFDEDFKAAADLDYMIRLGASCKVVQLDEILAVHGAYDNCSAISLEQRIEARLQFHYKHRTLFMDRKLEAVHRARMGHLYYRAGQRRRAFSAFCAALLKKPTHTPAWGGLARTSVWYMRATRPSRRTRRLRHV